VTLAVLFFKERDFSIANGYGLNTNREVLLTALSLKQVFMSVFILLAAAIVGVLNLFRKGRKILAR
jgi:hypothetical protein